MYGREGKVEKRRNEGKRGEEKVYLEQNDKIQEEGEGGREGGRGSNAPSLLMSGV